MGKAQAAGKEEKEKKAVDDRVKLTEDVVGQGGLYSKATINLKFEELEGSKSNGQIWRELFKQLVFHQEDIKAKSTTQDQGWN